VEATQKRFRDRANRAKRGLMREKAQYGSISDGSGKRYRACVYFVLSGDPKKAADFVDWFEREFPDDVGEPAFLLFSALAYRRTSNSEKSREYLLDTMLSNIYLLPYLYSEPLPKQDIWHPSNRHQPDYIWEIEQFLDEPTSEERSWFRDEFNSPLFVDIREQFISTYRALNKEHEFEKRGAILRKWYQYSARRRARET